MLSISIQRLYNQKLIGTSGLSPAQLVSLLGGIQAQNDSMAMWSIGARLPGLTENDIQSVIKERRIVRTWAMRGTLHYLAASDILSTLKLLAPGIIATNARRYKQLELDEHTLLQCEDILQEVLSGNNQLTREEIARVLSKRSISAEGQRAPYILQRAALDGLIYFGDGDQNQPTYTLLSDWLGGNAAPAKLTELSDFAAAYFLSHAPATLQDFSWWSGILSVRVKNILPELSRQVDRFTVGGKTYYGHRMDSDEPDPSVILLPAYDEYLLGYKDREASLSNEYAKRVNAGGGMPKPAVILNGRVIGTWKREAKKNRLVITVEAFEAVGDEVISHMEIAVQRYGDFIGSVTELRLVVNECHNR